MNKRLPHILFSLLLGVSVLFAGAGCDSSETDSDFEFLGGSWQVEQVSGENNTPYELQFDRASLTFFESASDRRFRLRGVNDGGDDEVIEGGLQLSGDDNLLLISSAFEQDVRLDYVVDASDRLILTTTSTGGSDLLFFLTGINFGQDGRGFEVAVTRDQQTGS